MRRAVTLVVALAVVLTLTVPCYAWVDDVAADDPRIVRDPEIKVVVNGELLVSSIPSILFDGRIMVPLCEMLMAIDRFETYNIATRTLSIHRGAITFTFGSTTVMVDGAPVEIPLAPLAINCASYLPLRFLADILGGTTVWDGETKTATVDVPPPPEYDGGARVSGVQTLGPYGMGVPVQIQGLTVTVESLAEAVSANGISPVHGIWLLLNVRVRNDSALPSDWGSIRMFRFAPEVDFTPMSANTRTTLEPGEEIVVQYGIAIFPGNRCPEFHYFSGDWPEKVLFQP